MTEKAAISRKRFLSLGLAAIGALGFACGMGSENDGKVDGVILHVHGTLSNELPDNPPGTIDFVLSGQRDALSGMGRSALANPDPAMAIQSFSIWDCRGSINGDVLTLRGTTSLASFQPLLGSPVDAEVNLKTGETTWSMGPFLGGRPKTTSRGKLTVSMAKTQVTALGSVAAPSGIRGQMP